jgi:membrane peptidoglycan carboxypeptidase
MTLDPVGLFDTMSATGADYDAAIKQRFEFSRGDVRLPGSRELDPIVVLEVRDRDGKIVFQQGPPETKQVVRAESVWLLHSILSDCSARFIFWPCGSSNADAALDFFISDGRSVPSGIAFGQQQFGRDETILDMWIAGYSRNAATVVWLGNADNSAFDKRTFGAISSRVAVILWKSWMGAYHDALRAGGAEAAQSFQSLRPPNVVQREFTPAVVDVFREDMDTATICVSTGLTWTRPDLTYESECVATEFDSRTGLLATDNTPTEFRIERLGVRLPGLAAEVASAIATQLGIPIAPR